MPISGNKPGLLLYLLYKMTRKFRPNIAVVMLIHWYDVSFIRGTV